MFSEIPGFVSQWHFSPRNLIDRSHIDQTKLISTLLPPLKAWGPHWESEWRDFCLWERRRHDLGERGGSSLGESWHRRAGRQEDTSLLIYCQVSFPPLRKALAFLIFDDSHLPSSFFLLFCFSQLEEKKTSGDSFAKEQVKRADIRSMTFPRLLGYKCLWQTLFQDSSENAWKQRNPHQIICPDIPFFRLISQSETWNI